MTTKTWLITGAGRGMGVEFARAALADGYNVAATGRNPASVASAIGGHENVLVTALDVIDPRSAEDAAAAAIEHFGRIDVLINNAGSFLAGFFEELADSDEPPLRWVAGEDLVEGVEHKARLLLEQVDAHRELSTRLAHDDAKAVA